MKKISSTTFFSKKAFPVLWFGSILAYLVAMSLSDIKLDSPMPIVVWVGTVVAGFYLFKQTVWHLIDEVYDNGDELFFRKGAKEQVVKLADIMNVSVSSSVFNSMERVTISVRAGEAIGEELEFIPRGRFLRFKTHPMVRDLIVRVDQARRAA